MRGRESEERERYREREGEFTEGREKNQEGGRQKGVKRYRDVNGGPMGLYDVRYFVEFWKFPNCVFFSIIYL